MRAPKKSPEEERLLTMARIYAEHPDNTVAERKLLEAAVEYTRRHHPAGAAPAAGPFRGAPAPFNPADFDPFNGAGWAEWIANMKRSGTGVRPASKETAEQYKRRKRKEEEAREAMRRAAEARKRPDPYAEAARKKAREQEAKAEGEFRREKDVRERYVRDPKDDDYPF